MEKLTKTAILLAIAALTTRNIDSVVRMARTAQISIIKESQASKWPKAMLLK